MPLGVILLSGPRHARCHPRENGESGHPQCWVWTPACAGVTAVAATWRGPLRRGRLSAAKDLEVLAFRCFGAEKLRLSMTRSACSEQRSEGSRASGLQTLPAR